MRRLENRVPWRFFLCALRLALQQRPDCIVCGHVSLGPMAFALSRIIRRPYISIVYGIDCWGDLFPQDEWCLKKSKRIISISHWTKNILLERGYNSKIIDIIHPIISSDLINSRYLSGPRNIFTLLTISRLDRQERYKGHDDVLEALGVVTQDRPDLKVRYLIQGTGDDQGRLIEKVNNLGLTQYVQFIESTPLRSQLVDQYSQADVFIMPSQFGKLNGRWKGEGFGIVYAEAGALGIPSIAYNCGGATDIIEHKKSGLLVTPGNIAELAHAIIFCADNQGVVSQMGAYAQQRVYEQFTSEQMDRSSLAMLVRVGLGAE